MQRIAFGEDWAEIRDPDDLTGEDEVKVKGALKLRGKADDDGYEGTGAGPAAMEIAMLSRVITSWSLPQPINAANIQALKLSQLKPLKAAIKPHMLELRDDPNSPSDT